MRIAHRILWAAFLPVAFVAAERPNLILVTADDMGCQRGCCGDAVMTTPNMDRLARDQSSHVQPGMMRTDRPCSTRVSSWARVMTRISRALPFAAPGSAYCGGGRGGAGYRA